MPNPLHIHIAEPCHENWQQMTPNEQGRHCASCEKTVVDFTFMSDQEILQHISRASSSVCGRFNNHQLDKTYTETKPKRAFTFRYAWNMMVATFLLMGNAAMAQSKKNTKKSIPVSQHDKKITLPRDFVLGMIATRIPERRITGTVIDDSTGLPVSFASIRIKGYKSGISANEAGEFILTPLPGKDTITIVVSAIGYGNNEFEAAVNGGVRYKVMLVQEAEELAPLEVVAGPVMGKIAVRHTTYVQKDTSCTARDSVTANVKPSAIEKVKQAISDWLPGKKSLRVYPNPVIPGNTVNINVNFSKTGEYKLQLMDASGRVVHVQALQVQQKTQIAQIPTQSSWSRGIYWVRISNATDKKVYQAKLLLQ